MVEPVSARRTPNHRPILSEEPAWGGERERGGIRERMKERRDREHTDRGIADRGNGRGQGGCTGERKRKRERERDRERQKDRQESMIEIQFQWNYNEHNGKPHE